MAGRWGVLASALHQCGQDSIPAWCPMEVEFVAGSRHIRFFFSGHSSFLVYKKKKKKKQWMALKVRSDWLLGIQIYFATHLRAFATENILIVARINKLKPCIFLCYIILLLSVLDSTIFEREHADFFFIRASLCH